MPCAVVIPVETVHAVEFLAVVLVWLHVAVGALGKESTVGIVVVDLLDCRVFIDHYPHVSLMVGEIGVIYGCFSAIVHIAAFDENSTQNSVFVDFVAYIVNGVRLGYCSGGGA